MLAILSKVPPIPQFSYNHSLLQHSIFNINCYRCFWYWVSKQSRWGSQSWGLWPQEVTTALYTDNTHPPPSNFPRWFWVYVTGSGSHNCLLEWLCYACHRVCYFGTRRSLAGTINLISKQNVRWEITNTLTGITIYKAQRRQKPLQYTIELPGTCTLHKHTVENNWTHGHILFLSGSFLNSSCPFPFWFPWVPYVCFQNFCYFFALFLLPLHSVQLCMGWKCGLRKTSQRVCLDQKFPYL